MKVELNLLSTDTCDLVASYFTYTEVVYKRVKVVVYDPQAPSFGSANVASPLPDVTIPLGTTYTPALPNIIPTPPVGTKFQCVIGITASRFDPDGNVTREQIATILFRCAKYKGMDTSNSTDLVTFPDYTNTGSWAKAAVEWAVAEGLITGAVKGGVTVLDPTGVASRAQVSTILYRFCKM